MITWQPSATAKIEPSLPPHKFDIKVNDEGYHNLQCNKAMIKIVQMYHMTNSIRANEIENLGQLFSAQSVSHIFIWSWPPTI